MEITLLHLIRSIHLSYTRGLSRWSLHQASGFQDIVGGGNGNVTKDCKYLRKVGWDVAHWIDLAVSDVKEGKVGALKDFFSNFISRTNSFADTLNRGKGYSS